jgi:acyl-CoA synthetase (AMP-forming)/AMP-acid ligase II
MAEKGERVLLFYPPGLDYVAAFFGCLYAGMIAVPSYPPRLNRSDLRLQATVDDAQATVALTTAQILKKIELRRERLPSLTNLHWLATDELVLGGEAWRDPTVTAETTAFLQYTSGSTSRPKGVILSHANLMHNLRSIQCSFGHTAESMGVIWLPPYHDMGLIGGILQPLYAGFPVVLMSPIDFLRRPWRWLQAVSHYRASTSGGPNFAYDLCVQKITPEKRATLDLSHWDVAFTGAEPVRHKTLERFAEFFAPCGFRHEAFYPCYGLAEATLFVTGGEKASSPVVKPFHKAQLEQHQVVEASATDEEARILVSSGRTLPDQQIVIVEPRTLSQCSQNQIGEVWISGPSVAQGYWRQPEKTAETFNAYVANSGAGPFLRTGDFGFLLDHELFVTGRTKDLIIIRGRNYYPQDIERTVADCDPGLLADGCAAFSIEVEDVEKLVVVQEVSRHYRKFDLNKVVNAIRQVVAEEYELQTYAVVLVKPRRVPKTSSGKVQRYRCRQQFLDGVLESLVSSKQKAIAKPSKRKPQDSFIYQALLALDDPQARYTVLNLYLQEQLKRILPLPEQMKKQHSWRELGMTSTMAAMFQKEIRDSLGVTLPETSILATQGEEELASAILSQISLPESTSK